VILLRKIITGFGTLITGEPVDQVKNKKICIPQIYLATHSRNPFVDICYGLREKRLRRVVLVKKKSYLSSTKAILLIFYFSVFLARVHNAGHIQSICEAYAAPNLWLICIREVENDS
jgi:hypothetical protein